MHFAPAGHAPRSVSASMKSRAPAAAEAPRRVRSRGSRIDLADGLETGSPYFHLYSPGLALSRGGSLSCSSSPLSESALICSSFSPRRFVCFVPSGSRVAELDVYLDLDIYKVRYIFIHIYIYIYIYIYIVEKYIQLYIVYDIQEPLGILLKWEHNVYLSSSKEVEVVSLGCWAEQPQLCSSSLFGECHFSYSPESESEWRARAEDGSADR